MCRMVLWASAQPETLARLLGEDRLSALVDDVARIHPDGWGMATGLGQEELAVVRSTSSAKSDPQFLAMARTASARAGLVHLRRATGTYAVSEVNTHPFTSDGWAFAHNGTIPDAERLDRVLSGESLDRRLGTTDSELYFLWLLEHLDKHGDIVEGIRSAVAGIREVCGHGSLNAALLGSDVLAVIHAQAGASPPLDLLLSTVGGDPAQLPPEHNDHYYDLRYRRDGGNLIVSSTGMPDPSWEPLLPESILTVDRSTGTVSIWPLAGGAPHATFDLAGWRPQ